MNLYDLLAQQHSHQHVWACSGYSSAIDFAHDWPKHQEGPVSTLQWCLGQDNALKHAYQEGPIHVRWDFNPGSKMASPFAQYPHPTGN